MISQIFEDEVNVDPLGDLLLTFLIEKDKEEPYIDFKETLSIGKEYPFAKIAKDIFAFANYGGGFLLIGFRDNKLRTESSDGRTYNYEPIGLPANIHIDQADLQAKFNAYSNSPLTLRYREFSRHYGDNTRRFGAIYIPPAPIVLKPTKDGTYNETSGKQKQAFKVDDILFRRGTQSVLASKEEQEWIRKRASKVSYKLSVISGQPDEIEETLYSNLFEVSKMPEFVWVASEKQLSEDIISPPESRWLAYRRWNSYLVSFEDLSIKENPLSFIADPRTARREKVSDWLSDPNRQRVIVGLLNKEITLLARKNGMSYDESRNRVKIFYRCDGPELRIQWVSRLGRSSTRLVAKAMYANQLHRRIFWHAAFTPKFIYLGEKLFLQISQTMIITDDGRRPTIGSQQGTIITRLTYNKYNASYLSNLFFWISRLSLGSETVMLASGKIEVSAKPVEAKTNFGILGDRTGLSDQADEKDELGEIENYDDI